MSGPTPKAPFRPGGLGTWQMGAKWGPQDDEVSLHTLHRALELGCHFLDTAQEYGDGRSERLIARFFAIQRWNARGLP